MCELSHVWIEKIRFDTRVFQLDSNDPIHSGISPALCAPLCVWLFRITGTWPASSQPCNHGRSLNTVREARLWRAHIQGRSAHIQGHVGEVRAGL